MKSLLNNKAYDILKWMAILFLPALATLIDCVFTIWDIPYGHQIATTIVAFDAFLGAILGISSIQYKKGDDTNTIDNNAG